MHQSHQETPEAAGPVMEALDQARALLLNAKTGQEPGLDRGRLTRLAQEITNTMAMIRAARAKDKE